MSEEIEVVWLGDLAQAQPGSDTDTFALCQVPGGCSSGQPLVRMTLAQLRDYLGVIASPPPTVFNGPDILAVMLGASCDTSGLTAPFNNHAFRLKYLFGQNCAITAVVVCNPNMPLSGIDFTVTTPTHEQIASGTLELPNVPDSGAGNGGSAQQFINTSGNMSDQFYLTITANPAPDGATCDVYILGFPMQPVQS